MNPLWKLTIMMSIMGICAFSCKKTKTPDTPNPCDNVTCLKTFQCDNGICKCPPETYDIKNECVLKSMSTYYSISDCNCYDTLIMKLPAVIDSSNFMQPIQFYFNWRTSFKTVMDRYRRYNTGDTFWTFGFDAPRCQINGASAFPEIFGKISPSRDSIFATIYWHTDNVTIVDTCQKVFVR
jgi:hypothetical protein